MKGVHMIRVTTRPVAECTHLGCGWKLHGNFHVPAATVRSRAQQHVKRYDDHIVNVTISDITEYSAEVAS